MTIKNKSFVALSLGAVLSSQSMIISSASQSSSHETVLSDDEVKIKINTDISKQTDPELSDNYNMGEIGSISTFSTRQLNLSIKKLSNPNAIGCGNVTSTNLTIRSGPSTSYSSIGTLKLNDTVEILSKTNNWYKIDYNGKNAYVLCSYIKLNPIEKGIDVSKWNGSINWTSVKNSGVDYVIIRAGYGTSTVDPQLENYIQGASNAGLKVGIYWFSYATNSKTAKIEAQSCLKAISKYKSKITYPVFFDFEYDSVSYAKSKGVTITKSLGTQIAQSFLNTIKASGYNTGIYTNNNFSSTYFSDDLLYANNLWIAQYNSTNTFQKPYSMWQYSERGSVPGIKTNVDLNYTCLKFTNNSTSNSISSSTTTTTSSKGVTNSDVNFRTWASTSYSKIGTIPKNSTVEILDSSNGWYKVKYNNKTGYVYSIYVNLNNATSSSSNNNSPASATSSKGVTNSDVNFRTGASTSYSKIGTIPKNSTVEILGSSNGWHKVKYNNKTGYVYSIYVKLNTTTSSNKGVTTTNLNFRKSASTSSLIISRIPKNTTIEILEKQSYGWYKIKYKGLTGYVSGIYIK